MRWLNPHSFIYRSCHSSAIHYKITVINYLYIFSEHKLHHYFCCKIWVSQYINVCVLFLPTRRGEWVNINYCWFWGADGLKVNIHYFHYYVVNGEPLSTYDRNSRCTSLLIVMFFGESLKNALKKRRILYINVDILLKNLHDEVWTCITVQNVNIHVYRLCACAKQLPNLVLNEYH